MKGAGGPGMIESTKNSVYFRGLGGVVEGASGPKIIENKKISLYFPGLGGVVDGANGPIIVGNRICFCIFRVWESW